MSHISSRTSALAGLTLVAVPLLLAGCTGDGESATPAPSTAAPVTAVVPSLPTAVNASQSRRVSLASVETARLKLDSPDFMELAAGSLWVKLDDGTVVRVDPQSATEQARVEPSAGDGGGPRVCNAFGVGGGAVWSCPPLGGAIDRIDPATNKVAARIETTVRADQGQLVSASGRMWVITRKTNEIVGIAHSGSDIGDPIALGASCLHLAAADPTVWAVCPSENQVVRVDTAKRAVTGRLTLTNPRQVVLHGDTAWVDVDGALAQIDATSLDVQALYEVDPGAGGSIWAGSDSVWVRSDAGPFLVEIDPQARKVVRALTARELPSGGRVLLADGHLWATAYNDATLVRIDPNR